MTSLKFGRIGVGLLQRGRKRMAGVEQFSKLEGEIREFVRHDSALRRTQRNETDIAVEPSVENLDALIRRFAGVSAGEIDRVILELQGVRDMLRGKGERVSQDIVNYERLNEAAKSTMKVVNDNLKQWKNGADDPPPANGTPGARTGKAVK